MVYVRKLTLAVSYAVVWALISALVHLYHTFFISHAQSGARPLPAEEGTPIMENIGLSCISNLLLGSIYVVCYVVGGLCQKLYFLSNGQRARQGPSYYCSHQQRGQEEASIHITPSMLWYYVYSIGLGLFCLSFTLHGSHFFSSFCLCVSTVVCAFWILHKEDKVGMDQPFSAKKVILVFVSMLDMFSLLLCLNQFCLLLSASGVLWGKGLWRNWACECLGPVLAPWAIAESRKKVRALHIPSHHVVLFGLPFIGVLSTGFLSMYIPLQECTPLDPWPLYDHRDTNSNENGTKTDHHEELSLLLLWQMVTGLDAPNTTTSALASWIQHEEWLSLFPSPPPVNMSAGSSMIVMPLLQPETILSQSFVELVVAGLVVPGLMYAALVVYTGAYNKAENLLVSSHGLWMVFLFRQCILLQNSAPLYLPAALISMLGWLLSLLYLLVHVHLSESSDRWQHLYGDLEGLSSLES